MTAHSMIVAQISDCHVSLEPWRGVADTIGGLKRAIASINAFVPRISLVLVSGDLAAAGTADEYRVARELLSSLVPPFCLIPGNHDLRAPMTSAFPELFDAGLHPDFLCHDRLVGGTRFLGLDTIIENQSGGELCGRRLEWLENKLAQQPDRDTVIVMHHPPFRTGLEIIDRHPFGGAGEFERIVAARPSVRGVWCGHAHRMMSTRCAGIPAYVAPSTGFQLPLDLTGEVARTFNQEPPGYLVHAIAEDAIVTYPQLVDRFQEFPLRPGH